VLLFETQIKYDDDDDDDDAGDNSVEGCRPPANGTQACCP